MKHNHVFKWKDFKIELLILANSHGHTEFFENKNRGIFDLHLDNDAS